MPRLQLMSFIPQASGGGGGEVKHNQRVRRRVFEQVVFAV
jgi:hypothetical protein